LIIFVLYTDYQGDIMNNTRSFLGDTLVSFVTLSKLFPKEYDEFARTRIPMGFPDNATAAVFIHEATSDKPIADCSYPTHTAATRALVAAARKRGLDLKVGYSPTDHMVVLTFPAPMLDYTLKPEAAALLDKLGMDMDAVIPYAPSVVTNG
jgi:hypothetical protein